MGLYYKNTLERDLKVYYAVEKNITYVMALGGGCPGSEASLASPLLQFLDAKWRRDGAMFNITDHN